MSGNLKAWLGVGLIGAYTILTWRALPPWTSNLTLWAEAVERAPFKPRPRLNYAGALLEAGQMTEGVRQMDLAETLLAIPSVPEWDRQDAYAAITTLRGLQLGR